ncbi:lipopolysaccharide biosynthesis protein [Rathayibacter sp. VKM Ac-2630]|uniref:lipopolysaccharide biosynthesis protein n=1 Tax=Rathayibacter sp. VKM Ac-2630 TaxID=1938617 RepID=UPI00130180D9|nr:lipopolysaccharide biosynthesis protein [Rathayibacter sp. VKM Ac-2630]
MTILGQAGKVAIQLASIVVMSRLLSPADFGLVAMLGIFIAIGELLRDFGLTAAAIRARDLSNKQKSTLFWINSAIGVALFATMAACSVPISMLYGESRLVPLAPVVALIFLINGIQAQFMVELVRGLRFTALAVSDLLGQLGGFIVAVGTALAGWGYWSLVFQMIVAFAVTLVIRVFAAKWRPGLPSRSAHVRDLIGFGGQVGVAQTLSYAASNVDTLVVGLRWDANVLGFYNRAYQLMSLPVNQLLNPLTNVALPLLTGLREERERLWGLITTAQIGMGYMLVTSLAIVAGSAEAAFAIILGSQWSAAIPIFQVLAFGACFQVLSQTNYWVFLTFGLGRSLVRSNLVTKSIGIVLPVVGSTYGVLGVAAGYSVALLVAWPINLLWLRSVAQMPSGRFLISGARTIALGAVAFATSWAASSVLHGATPILSLAASLAASLTSVAVLVGIVPVYRRDVVMMWSTVRLLRG